MRIVLIASKGMGQLVLAHMIAENKPPVAVVARWDDPNQQQWYPSVATLAKQASIPVLKPTQINDPAVVAQIASYQPDLLFTVFYPKIYKQPLLDIPKLGAVNLHFAPLPKYRGSFPGAWAIINGEKQHGVTIHKMATGVDNGAIVDQIAVPIDAIDTGRTLYEKCERAGLVLFKRFFAQLKPQNIQGTPQNTADVVYRDRNYPYGGTIQWQWTAQQVVDYVRAMTFPPFVNAIHSYYQGKRFGIIKAEAVDQTGQAGELVAMDAKGMVIACAEGAVNISAVRDEKDQPIALQTFVLQYKLAIGRILGR